MDNEKIEQKTENDIEKSTVAEENTAIEQSAADDVCEIVNEGSQDVQIIKGEATAENTVTEAPVCEDTTAGEDITESDGGAKEEFDLGDGDSSIFTVPRDEDEFVFDDGAPRFEEIEPQEPNYTVGGEAEDDADDSEAEKIPEEDREPTPEKKVREKKVRTTGNRRLDTLFDFIELFIFTLVGVLIVTSFLFRHSIVSGNSMQNTLQNGDRLIISDLFYEPEYGDIVVVEDREAGIQSPIVKRVIATEGQTVRITYYDVSVDGAVLDEPYVFTDGFSYCYDLDPFAFRSNETLVFVPGEYYEFVVPDGEIFVLGDHRNDSRDSRYYGTVREDSVLGRLIVRFYPFDAFEFYVFDKD